MPSQYTQRDLAQRDAYAAVMGRQPPPPVPETHPLAWQWAYKGSRKERERLEATLGRKT